MFNAIQRFWGGDGFLNNNRVVEIKSESLGTLQILARDEAMVLFAPPYNEKQDKKYNYEIVLQRPTSESTSMSFSLYRSTAPQEAEERFNIYLHRLPQFVSIAKEFYSVNGLQKICDILTENPSWSLTHLIVYFNLTDYVSNPKVLDCIDYPDHLNLMSPFQLAIKTGNVEMVKKLLPICKIEHMDKNNDSVFHYAASSNKEIIDLLTPRSKANLNALNNDGYTALHLSCLSDKPDCVEALLRAGADPNVTVNMSRGHKSATTIAEFFKGSGNNNKLFKQEMKYGGTPLHWCSSRETLNALIASGCDVNAKNFVGRTALHVMVARNRFDCVISLLGHDAEIDLLDNDGNSSLHIAIEKRLVSIVKCLVVFGCDINLKNKLGQTPRHLAGKEKGGAEEILYILHSCDAKRCDAASVDCPPGCISDGFFNGIPPETPESVDTREHIEDMLASTSRQVTGLFGNANGLRDERLAEPTIINTEKVQKGQSIMDALLGMFTSKANAESKKDGVSESGSGNNSSGMTTPVVEVSPTTPTSPEINATESPKQKHYPYGRGRLLCLDGGGIRGLVLVQMLLEIEQISQTPIVHMFDWIAGTSTGGILALGLGCGKTMRQLMSLYIRMKEQCFVGSRPYTSEYFENILKENLGELSVMTDIKHPKLMVTAVMADRKPVDLHLFRNYDCASDLLGIVTPITNRRAPPPPPRDQLIWKAARATGAAPSYFRAFGTFLDGGLIANNPTLDAMTEIHEYNMALRSVGREAEAIPVSTVVSLGTGLIPVTELKNIDVFRPEGVLHAAAAVTSIMTIGNLLVDQATASDGRVVDRARAWCSIIGVPYTRLNPQLSEDIALDEKDDKKIVNMMWQTKAYMHENRSKILQMINTLKLKNKL